MQRHSLMEGGTLYIALLRNVTDMAALLEKVKSKQLYCVLANPAFIMDVFHAQIVANRAHLDILRGCSRTGQIHTEALFALGSSAHIPTALQSVEVKGQDTSAVVLSINPTLDQAGVLSEQLSQCGQLVDIAELSSCNFMALSQKFKVKEKELVISGRTTQENARDALTCAFAVKGIIKT